MRLLIKLDSIDYVDFIAIDNEISFLKLDDDIF
jgi:hypothetical protein